MIDWQTQKNAQPGAKCPQLKQLFHALSSNYQLQKDKSKTGKIKIYSLNSTRFELKRSGVSGRTAATNWKWTKMGQSTGTWAIFQFLETN